MSSWAAQSRRVSALWEFVLDDDLQARVPFSELAS